MSGHYHGHEHDHGHEHGHGAVGSGPAVLDIGDDIGALVATMPRDSAGTELFVRRADDQTSTVYTGVWERQQAGRRVTAAVFPELREGTYHVLDENGADIHTVEIRGGVVTTIDLIG
jgi:hypothetical protein